ncbi:MotA/TolQ/ExbB proton channel family protein [Maridesulfovibrio salexigens]|uniref:MotA/TolQ/ExbB proton channel n=1 Tax=Maridesulfovibrio salexigens (strain ATCC 14822 / DSM 2638 / NCIMB 8403 / VKM B-1763) TaxID=526222 RepID=C6BWH7_MARSD|nr:MotA/TolQ/ExbB proton channel family protein [Maridesulfovibrio salexigens]ACS78421.1 MotA/TolQ/ExbB proton channel [Maridesulfovibrio salexigens DSM 2638]
MNILQQGGLIMWPLFLLSIASLAVMGERFFVFSTNRFPKAERLNEIVNLARQHNTDKILSLVEETSPLYLKIFNALFSQLPNREKKHEVQLAGEEILFSLNRRLDFLATVATAAPLIGLLGTVLGMIQAFSRLSASGNVDITMLAGGIWQALLTTAAGLSVAIPALIAHRWFCRQHEKAAYAMQHTANMLLEIQED